MYPLTQKLFNADDNAKDIADFGGPVELATYQLVSVFLRILEYCKGIFFLTTNRVSDFEEAILSRINLMLKYDALGLNTRKQI